MRQPMIGRAVRPPQSYNRAMERPLLLLIRAGLMLVLLIPLVVTSEPLPQTYFPYIVGKALYGRFLIEIIFGLWIILITGFPAYRPPKSWIVAVFAIFLLGSLIAALAGVSITRSLWSNYERMQGVVDLVHWFGFVLVSVSTLRTLASWRVFVNANIAVSLVVAIMGITQSFDVRLLPHLVDRDRIDITLGNPVYVGAYMLVALTTALALLAHSFEHSETAPASAASAGSRARRRRRQRKARSADGGIDPKWLWRAFWMTAIALDFIVLLMAGARGALIGLAVALGTVAIVFIVQAGLVARAERSVAAGLRHLVSGPNAWLKVGSVGGLILIVAVVATLGLARDSSFVQRIAESNRMVAQLASFGTGEDSTDTRLNSTKMGLVGFAQRPLFGWGPENFAVAYDANVGAERFSFQAEAYDQAHNKVVEELTTKGLVGFVPFAIMWILVAWAYIRTLRRPNLRGQHFTLLMGAATLGYFVQNLFLFDTPATALQVYILLGFAAVLEVNLQRDPAKQTEEGDYGASAPERPWYGEGVRLAGEQVVRLWKYPEMHVPVVLGVVTVALIFLNVFAFNASRLVGDALEEGADWEVRMERFDKGINRFPSLGNQARLNLLRGLTQEYRGLDTDQRQKAMQFAIFELDAGIEAEPQDWRIKVAGAEFYQVAAIADIDFLEEARFLLDEAWKLAPERVELFAAQAQQYLLEDDMAGAQTVLNDYLRLNPESRYLLQFLIDMAFPNGGAG